MDCPKCNAKMSDLEKIELVSDVLNEYNRKQLTFVATHKENIHWNGKKYHCSKCGIDFSFKDGILNVGSNT